MFNGVQVVPESWIATMKPVTKKRLLAASGEESLLVKGNRMKLLAASGGEYDPDLS